MPQVLLHNCSFAMTCMGGPEAPLGLVEDAAILINDGLVGWVGPESELSKSGPDFSDAIRHDAEGRLVSPGLVDCHAHPLFAGRRAAEFERRARGDHYLDIAKEGGGINATVGPTRAASTEELVDLCRQRCQRAFAWGTTTMEAKSGYDLSTAGELRLLEVAKAVNQQHPVDLVPTLLGAHVVPPEFQADRAGYVQCVIDEMIPAAAERGLAGAVDVYCDEGAFTLGETKTILLAAKQAGLAVKAHVGQFTDLGGPQLLAELGGLSGDHLEQISAEGMAAMAQADVVATMLPGACIQLRMDPPPVAALRDAGVKLALGSDLNPGTAHSETLTVPMWLATTHLSMTVEEAWLAVTRHAAQAIGRSDIGRITPGARADLVLWDAELPAEIPYHYGVNLVHCVYKDGVRHRQQIYTIG